MESSGGSEIRYRTVFGEREIRERATEEVARALRYSRPLSFLLVACDAKSGVCETRVLKAAGSLVRTPDIVGRFGESALLFIFPETGDTATVPAKRVLLEVQCLEPAARGVLVRCPHNGMDADELLHAASSALFHAKGGELVELPDKVEKLGFGPHAPIVIAVDEKMKRLFVLLRNLAKSELPILILGETGVGKEAAAAAVHHGSKYRDGPFVAVNCAAMPANLLESELFGYEKGAFSGATAAKPGLVETADKGTLFLDEISEASPETQAKLLRVLETRCNRRIGAIQEIPVQIRLVSAANRSLDTLLADDGFRRDLFYRIGGARIEIPPLRERPADILPLAHAFLADAGKAEGGMPPKLSAAAAEMLLTHSWPGNVRELRHAMTYVAAVTPGPIVEPNDLAAAIPGIGTEAPPPAISNDERKPEVSFRNGPPRFQKLSEEIAALESKRMSEALRAVGGARGRAAELLGMPLRTFVSKMKRYRLTDVGRSERWRAEG